MGQMVCPATTTTTTATPLLLSHCVVSCSNYCTISCSTQLSWHPTQETSSTIVAPYSRRHSHNCRGVPLKRQVSYYRGTPLASSPWNPTQQAYSALVAPLASSQWNLPTQAFAHPLCVPTAHTLIGILKLAMCPLKHSHTHSVCPLRTLS